MRKTTKMHRMKQRSYENEREHLSKAMKRYI